MKEYIGNVELNYSNYQGKDLYSDGEVEDELLEIVKTYDSTKYSKIIEERNKWPIFYHLSHIRTNIIEWIPITKEDKILEVGAGCGAITGILADKAKQVTCIELSKKRSLINAYRHKEKDNINILIGNFEDIEPTLTEQYDYITLIGVYEYAESYIHTKQPYIDFLKTMQNHLKENGKLIIAIENKLGLKYWAGCKEDHVGLYYEGLEGYTRTHGIKTFSKKELEILLNQGGFNQYIFYYPYPDYKFPMTIYSDDRLPQVGELIYNLRNFDQDRIVNFDESKVFDTLINNNLFPIFSNSYLIIAEKEVKL